MSHAIAGENICLDDARALDFQVLCINHNGLAVSRWNAALHWVSPYGRLPLHQPAPGNCLIAAMATIGREQMSTPGGRTNEGPLSHPKKLKTPRLG